MEFNIALTPPATEQISTERELLQKALNTLKLILYPAFVACYLLAGTLLMLWMLKTGELSYHAAALATIYIAVAALIAFLACRRLEAPASFGSLMIIVALLISAFITTVPSGSGLGVYRFYFFLVSIIMLYVAIYVVDSKVESRFKHIELMDNLAEGRHRHHCLTVMEACQNDATCDEYRLAVAKMGRPLIVGEAVMLEKHATKILNARKWEEYDLQKEVACVVLQCKEPLSNL